ncbi:hypothetical protein [Rubripirellula reticaptiva]|uniref:Uncharacterized protein n=1 Tax=Rubripirellula reticaptiva TaxID=2528013 RepID=A0A5C6EPM5_9BACT|nr:hypothetical protein [Rubripirellula reticaptiva]TWU49299.1 hypothetical protein Poly59_39130 [Rubripirellula reticaptiva]
MARDQQTQEQLDNYRQAIADVAENIIAELEADDTNRDESLQQLVNEQIELHDYVINSELQIHTLLYSAHPCAAFFNGTHKDNYASTDDFPFAVFASDAFEQDVIGKVKDLLGDE